ncbi:MAG: UvrD-helicase domain-containing protein [Bdellovibrionaceae bacterium]|nr:UvrD-helicase domain-containing protein [Pseudobdellovibrionaceae bacterium]
MNPPQAEAVQTIDGPLLILAGAGSGKTRVLTHRIARMIQLRKAAPSEILAVTFTNKAAREMESRVFDLMTDMRPQLYEPLWITTFHSACVRILRQTIELLDYKRGFVIYDDSDQLAQIKRVMNALNISDKITPAKTFKNRINNLKMLGYGPQEAEKSSKVYIDNQTLDVYRHYEAEMKKANSLDFGDLLLKVYELFRMYPDVLQQYRQKFRYVLVDEYQDTNNLQYRIIKLLSEQHRNLCVVGDEDQSIYSWRGADISNILDFEKDFPEAKVVKLEQNYRSTNTIVSAASSVIRNNTERKDKTLFTENDPGEKIVLREERTDYDEARWVVREIQRLIANGETSYEEVAVFYRTNAQSRVLEEHLRMNSIPYKIVGGVRFYDRAEVKDILAYLKLILNPADDISFKRAVNSPARGIGKTTIEKLEAMAFQGKMTLMNAARHAVDHREFNAGTTSKLRGFLNLIDEMTGLAEQLTLLDLYTTVIDKTEYVQRLKTEESVEADARISNLEELGNAMAQFQKERTDASLQTFLEEMALVSDLDSVQQDDRAVTLMTLHLSKGLEYNHVFVVGWEENLFPSSMQSDDGEDKNIEEERRLAYVGMTRARKKLHLSYARSRRVWGQEQMNPPSRFLNEIPKDALDFQTGVETPKFLDRYGGGAGSYAGSSAVSDNSFRSKMRTPGRENDRGFEAQSFSDDADAGAPLTNGMRVRHPTFGVGTIYQTEGMGEQMKVSVLFADQTIKKFVAKYARLERV